MIYANYAAYMYLYVKLKDLYIDYISNYVKLIIKIRNENNKKTSFIKIG